MISIGFHRRLLLVSLVLILLNACATGAKPRHHGFYRPYQGKGDRTYQAKGVASWYGGKFHGRRTASGERYNKHAMTAAHRTLPFGAFIKVINQANNKTAIVKINDRGPFIKGRMLDLSKAAARKIDMLGAGTARVQVTWIDDPPNHPNLSPERRSILREKKESLKQEEVLSVEETVEQQPVVTEIDYE